MHIKRLAVRLFQECWHEGRLGVLDEILAPGHVFHPSAGDMVGIQTYRDMLAAYRRAFTPTYQIVNTIAEGDYAALHYIERGRFDAAWEWAGGQFLATGKTYQTFGVEMLRGSGGRIVEAWPGHDSFTHFSGAGLARFC